MKKIKILLALVLCMTMLSLVACTPSLKSVEDKFKDAEYTTKSLTTEQLSSIGVESEDVESSLFALKVSLTGGSGGVMIVWFKSESKAKETYNKLNEDKKNENVIRKGKMVAVGDSESLEIL